MPRGGFTDCAPTWWLGRGRARLGLSVGLGAGVAMERTETGTSHWSGLAWASPPRGPIERQLAVALDADVPVTLPRRDDRLAVTLLPLAWRGLSRAF